MAASETLHATAVAIRGRAVLLLGPSGAGKSDLALRLVDRGALLIADDRTPVESGPAGPVARAPERLAGRIEVRGLGIVALPWCAAAPVALAVRLRANPERLPEPDETLVAGWPVRAVTLDPRPASAAVAVELALAQPERAA